jgi:AcrR family transcriptional regulator
MNLPEVHTKRKNLPHDERRQMILDAALKIFSRHGYEAADVDDIAREARIGKGTIYRHYASKRELFVAVVDRGFEQLRCQMDDLNITDITFEERIKVGLERHVEFFIENPDYWRVLMLGKPKYRLNLDEEKEQLYQRFSRRLIEGIKAGITAGYLKKVDPILAAHSLMSMATVIVERHWLTKKSTLKKDISNVTDIFLRGIKK